MYNEFDTDRGGATVYVRPHKTYHKTHTDTPSHTYTHIGVQSAYKLTTVSLALRTSFGNIVGVHQLCAQKHHRAAGHTNIVYPNRVPGSGRVVGAYPIPSLSCLGSSLPNPHYQLCKAADLVFQPRIIEENDPFFPQS